MDIAFTPLLDAQRSALGTLALPAPRRGRGVFGPDAYRFCKLISDTIETAVDIGCESGAGGMRFYSVLVVPGTTGRRMGGKCGTLSGSLRDNPACSRPILLSRAPRSTSFQTGMNYFLEGQMRSLKLGLAATAAFCALSATAQADCVKVGSGRRSCDPRYRLPLCDARSGKRHLWAGPRGQGPGPHEMRRRLKYDDVSLHADSVQSDDTQNLLRRLALLPRVTPLLGVSEE